MMTHIQNKFTAPSFAPVDANKTLRSIATYAWIGSGALFICYSYFVGAITFSVIKQQALGQSMKALVSTMSKQELSYLASQKDLNLAYAQSLGLATTSSVAYATATSAFAWNVGR